MTSNKRINIRSIVLSIGLAIIAIAITLIIIISGIGIQILKANATDHKTVKVAALQLNKLDSKGLSFDRNPVGEDLRLENELNLAGDLALELKSNKVLAKSLNLHKQLLVSDLENSKSLLLNELTNDQRQLDLNSLQSLLKLQPSLSQLG
jgi:hypothetical protein